jgi:hypothetical protein
VRGSTTVLDVRSGRWIGRVQLVFGASFPIDALVVARDGRAAWGQTGYELGPSFGPTSIYALGLDGTVSTLATGRGVESLTLRIRRPAARGLPSTVTWREDGTPRAATLADPPRPVTVGAP